MPDCVTLPHVSSGVNSVKICGDKVEVINGLKPPKIETRRAKPGCKLYSHRDDTSEYCEKDAKKDWALLGKGIVTLFASFKTVIAGLTSK